MPLHEVPEEILFITLAALISDLFIMHHPLVDDAIIHPSSFILTEVTLHYAFSRNCIRAMIQFHVLPQSELIVSGVATFIAWNRQSFGPIWNNILPVRSIFIIQSFHFLCLWLFYTLFDVFVNIKPCFSNEVLLHPCMMLSKVPAHLTSLERLVVTFSTLVPVLSIMNHPLVQHKVCVAFKFDITLFTLFSQTLGSCSLDLDKFLFNIQEKLKLFIDGFLRDLKTARVLIFWF